MTAGADATVSNIAQSEDNTQAEATAWYGWHTWWPPLGYLVLTLLLTWPLALHLGNGIAHFISSDHYQNLWNIWWFRTALFEQHKNPFYTDVLFYPYRDSQHPLELYFHTLQPALMLFASPLSYLIGTVGSFNLIVLLSFVTGGWGMFFLARYFTQNPIAAFIAGAIFDFCAYHFNILSVGQTNLLPIGTMPLYILFLHKSVAPLRPETERNRRVIYPLLAIVVLVFASYIDWYYPLYLLLYSAGLFAVLLITRPREWRFTVVRFFSIMASWLVLVSLLLFSMLRSTTTDTDVTYKSSVVFEIIHSSALLAMFTPVKDMRIAPGAWLQPFWGYTALGLAVVGLWFCRKQQGWWRWWLGVILVFGVLSLGPYLRLNQTDDANVAIAHGLPLPYLLIQNIPPISFSRSPGRMQIIIEMALALLAAFGVSGLMSALDKWSSQNWMVGRRPIRVGMPVVALVLLCLEMQTLPWPIEIMSKPPIFEQIAKEPSNFAVLDLPLTNHGVEDAHRMYYQTIHQRPIAGGYIARHLIDYYRGNGTPFDDFFDTIPPGGAEKGHVIVDQSNDQNGAVRLLNYYNFRYVFIYKDEYWSDSTEYWGNTTDPTVIAAWQRNYNYVKSVLGANNQIYQDDNLTVFKVPQLPPTKEPVVYSLINWYDAEGTPPNRYRWANNDPTIQGASFQAQRVQLKLTAWAYQPGSVVSVQLNGQEITKLTLQGQAADYTTPTFELPQGQFDIVLHNLTPAVSPQTLDPNSQDPRLLSLAASHIQLSLVGNN